jgi:hypothetical protein
MYFSRFTPRRALVLEDIDTPEDRDDQDIGPRPDTAPFAEWLKRRRKGTRADASQNQHAR